MIDNNQICFHFFVHRGHEADVNAVVSIHIKVHTSMRFLFCQLCINTIWLNFSDLFSCCLYRMLFFSISTRFCLIKSPNRCLKHMFLTHFQIHKSCHIAVVTYLHQHKNTWLMKISMTSLLEHSMGAQPTEFSFLLKSWCSQIVF